DRQGVPAARAVHDQPGPRLQARGGPRPRMGGWLRDALEPGRRLRQEPEAQAGRRRHRDRARPWLSLPGRGPGVNLRLRLALSTALLTLGGVGVGLAVTYGVLAGGSNASLDSESTI